MAPRLLVRLLLVVLVSAGTMVGAVTAPASAEVCRSATGVSVVVDFRELGGGAQTVCDGAGGGRSAWTILEESGFALREVARQPGFVCQVDGLPADQECRDTPPQNAYWGLYWSDGTDGSWTYSSLGARDLRVPAGGSVAFAWQGQQSGPPATTPPVSRSQEPSPSTQTTTADPSPSSSPSTSPTTTASTAPTASPTGSASSDERETRRLRREADREAQAAARAEARARARRQAAVEARREAAAEERAERRREARQDRDRDDVEAAEESLADDDTAAAADDAAGGRIPTWVTGLVLAGMALLALLLAVLRRRAARAG